MDLVDELWGDRTIVAIMHSAKQLSHSRLPTLGSTAIAGTIVAFITAISLAVTYIPSVTSTTLKLRSGVIPSLRSPGFARYRFAADQVTILTGSMFWGT